jgi:hypothetical protein
MSDLQPTPAPTPTDPKGAEDTPAQLPDDHPLVKTLAAQKDEIKSLKEKAARLDQIEQANKTDAEKAADRIAKAEAEAASVPTKVAEILRDALVTLGVVSEDRKVLMTASEPQALLEQVKAIRNLPPAKTGRAPLQGRTPTPNADDPMREFAHGVFARHD